MPSSRPPRPQVQPRLPPLRRRGEPRGVVCVQANHLGHAPPRSNPCRRIQQERTHCGRGHQTQPRRPFRYRSHQHQPRQPVDPLASARSTPTCSSNRASTRTDASALRPPQEHANGHPEQRQAVQVRLRTVLGMDGVGREDNPSDRVHPRHHAHKHEAPGQRNAPRRRQLLHQGGFFAVGKHRRAVDHLDKRGVLAVQRRVRQRAPVTGSHRSGRFGRCVQIDGLVPIDGQRRDSGDPHQQRCRHRHDCPAHSYRVHSVPPSMLNASKRTPN